MIWSVLGIEPTKDKKAITAAYREKLLQVNPEDKPEEFKALRGAYEEAMKYAQQPQAAPIGEKTPPEQWYDRIRGLYDDFAARIRPENWEALLRDDFSTALDTRPAAEEVILKFLMEDYFIPQECWQVLDRVFSWRERRKELYESCPRDFVDYAVINGIELRPNLPYDLFDPGRNGADCDRYRRLYHQALGTAPDALEPVLEQMAALSERHPYGDAIFCRMLLVRGEIQQGREGLRRLAQQYPGDVTLNLSWAAQCVRDGQWAEGERLCRQILELSPREWQAKRMLVDCLSNLDRQEEAKSLIFELIHAAGGDRKLAYELQQTVRGLNETLIARREPAYRADPADADNALKLGWCYLQNDRDEDALAVCRSVDPERADAYDYHLLYAKTAYSLQDYDTAMAHLGAIEEVLRGMKPDGNQETLRRMGRLPEVLQMQAAILLSRKDKAGALEKNAQAMALAPEDPEILTQTAFLLNSLKDHSRAVQVLEKVTHLLPHSYHGYLLLAESLYELGRDRDAFDAVNRAMDLERGDLGVYVLKMRILLRNGVFDAVRQILDFLYENGITDDLSVMWCEAQLTEYEQKDYPKALEQYQAIARRLENGEHLPWACQVYYRINVIVARDLDMRKPEDREKLLPILEKGLSHDEDDFDCLEYKAWILKRHNRTAEALELYHRLEKRPRRNLAVEQELAELYYRNLAKNADKALHYYQLLLDQEEKTDLHFYVGTCLRYLGRWQEAEAHYLREKEMDPEDVDAYNCLGIVYEAMGCYEDALACADKVIDLRKDLQGDQSRYHLRRIQILRRMGRWQEAVDTVDAMTEKYGYDDGDQMKFDIYCQFGLWDLAGQHLDAWRKSRKKVKRCAAARIKLDMLTGRIDRVRKAMASAEKRLNVSDRDTLSLQLADLDGDAEYMLRIWQSRAAAREENTHELMNMAQVLWSMGRIDEARGYAAQTLEKLDKILQTRTRYEALYRGRRALMLAMLGRFGEAEEELALVRRLPLCDNCDYCACKDADHFEAFMEEIRENYVRAMALHRTAMERWPDEIDFACGVNRMHRKGIDV